MELKWQCRGAHTLLNVLLAWSQYKEGRRELAAFHWRLGYRQLEGRVDSEEAKEDVRGLLLAF